MKVFLRILIAVILSLSFQQCGWCSNIALLIPTTLFLMGEDPINYPEDKEFLLETMADMEPGLQWLVLHLEKDLGHLVNIYNSASDVPADVQAANDLIFISEALGSGSIAADYKNSKKPVICTEFYLLDDMGLTNGQSSFTGGASNLDSTIKFVNTNHPIAQGLPAEFIVTINDEATGKPAVATFGTVTNPDLLHGVGEVLAVLPTSIDESASGAELPENVPILIVVEKGTSLDNGGTSQANWVFLGYSDVNPVADYGGVPGTRTLALLNANGVKLLDNVVAWAFGQLTSVDQWTIF
ncbi:MAG: hypothetical protein AB1656_04240 [Candidatus Omnitrophota bacterium]